MRMKLPDDSPVEYWLKGEKIQNFGDYLTEFFMRELFYPIGMKARAIRIIGSTIADFFIPDLEEHETENEAKSVVFWGCGLREPRSLSQKRRSLATVLSVRGPLSARDLGLGATLPQCDPAFLLPALYTPQPAHTYRGRTVCIPHFHDKRDDEELRSLSGCDLILRPNMPADLAATCSFIDAIASADFVLSAAMHGAITAAAYRRPFAFWDSGQIDLPYKWRDIGALLNIPVEFQSNLQEARQHYISAIKPNLVIPSPWSTLATAPFLLRPDAVLKIVRHELSSALSSETPARIDLWINELEKRRPHVEAIVSDFLNDRACLKAEVNRLENEKVDLQAEVKRLGQERAQNGSEIDRLKRELALSTTELDKLGTALGARDEELRQERAQSGSEIDRLKRELALNTTEIDKLRTALGARDGELASLRQERAQSGSEIDGLKHELTLSTIELDKLRTALGARDGELAARDRSLSDKNAEVAAVRAELAARTVDVSSLEATIRALRASTSWRITALLRAAKRLSGRSAYTYPVYPFMLVRRALKGRSLAPLRNWRAERVIARSGLFDKDWYQANNLDVRELGINPLRHYLVFGANEGRDPGPFFNTRRYLAANTDVANARINPLAHYVLYGAAEGRACGTDLHAHHRSEITTSLANTGGRLVMTSVFAALRAYGPKALAATVWRVLRTEGLAGITFRMGILKHGRPIQFRNRLSRHVRPHSARVDIISGRKALLQTTRSFTRLTPASWPAEPTAVMERGPCLPSANASGWVLVADDFPPLYDQQSGGLRLKTLIDIIGEQGWPIVFASRFPRSGLPGVLSTEAGITRYQAALQEAGVNSFAYGLDEVDETIAALGAKLRYAFLSRPQVAHDFIPCVRSHCPTATIIYDMVDFHALRIAREAELKHDANLLATAEEIKAIEVAAARAADITIAISNEEKSAVLDLVPTAVVDVLPNIFTMATADPPGTDKRSGLFFVGGFWHEPNVDAVTWFVQKIWPRIRGELPECRFRIAGSYPSDEVLALARTPGVDVLGFVPDLAPLFNSARVFVAPLRYGAGVKGKVGQSLAHGLPVVTTAIGAEGMNLLDGEHALIACDPIAFASQVVRLLCDDALWTRLQAQGRSLAQSAFSVEAVRDKMADLFHV
jgi:O-antigen biosynthesis protein